MTLLVDPAALGGLAGLIAVASWAMGRTQGLLVDEGLPDHRDIAPPERPVADSAPRPGAGGIAAAPCQQRALEERRAALARPFALAELHAEASAIRRDERILGAVPSEEALIVLTRAAPGAGCRFIGRSGQPTCPAPTRLSCADSGACEAARAQPSPDVSSLTRV
jgi:hypothetical protein